MQFLASGKVNYAIRDFTLQRANWRAWEQFVLALEPRHWKILISCINLHFTSLVLWLMVSEVQKLNVHLKLGVNHLHIYKSWIINHNYYWRHYEFGLVFQFQHFGCFGPVVKHQKWNLKASKLNKKSVT